MKGTNSCESSSGSVCPACCRFRPTWTSSTCSPLNVLIGPNASGKSNFIEVLGLLSAMPFDFAAAIRDGGGAAEWLWKGSARPAAATIEVETGPRYGTGRPLRYRLSFGTIGPRVNIVDEAVEEVLSPPGSVPYFSTIRFSKVAP